MVRGPQCRGAWLLFIVALCVVSMSEAAAPKKSSSKGSGLIEQWKTASAKEIAKDALAMLVIYEGLTVAWMGSTWLLAWIIQPTKLGLVHRVASCFSAALPSVHGPQNVNAQGPVSLADRVSSHFKYYESRAEHALEFVSNTLPLDLRHLGFSYAESAIFRKCTVPLTAPAKLFGTIKILQQLKEDGKL